MEKGIIYIMTTIVPGLIKIGQTGETSFENRMYNLEHNGYCNVTGLKRKFAILVDNYAEKEKLLHTIFEKSRIADTELFAQDVNIVVQLLSSFDGIVIYPKTEKKNEVFAEATDNITGKLIPDGVYTFSRKKKSDNKQVIAKATIDNGCWTLKKGSILGISEDAGVSQKARAIRAQMTLDRNGKLLEDIELGECSPSFASVVVLNQSADGWTDWKTIDGKAIDIYRLKDKSDK